MATVNGAAADVMRAQPVVMTMEQFNQLGQLVVNNHTDENLQKLQHAAKSIDRCDELGPEHVQTWIRNLDGWQSEKMSDQFMMDLAKATSTGDLLKEIRAWVNNSIGWGIHAMHD